MTLRQGQAKEARVNGARLPSAESLRREVATLVFTPDRLAVVKGGPAARRAYFDRVLGRLLPRARGRAAGLPRGARAAQRGAPPRAARPLGRERARAVDGAGRRARRGARRRRAGDARGARAGVRRARRASSGLPAARSATTRRPPTRAALESRLARDLERGATGLGPHLDDVLIASGDRDLRQFGSQGEQRLAVLSLLLAEAELLPSPPLLLLDDVLSELDPGRRQVLAERVAGMGQTMITATHALGAADRARADRGGRALDPLGSQVRAELSRFGPQAGMAELVERWPQPSATAIARNAWPARIARDGTVHVNTADSVWAFELGQRAAEIAGGSACPRCASRPGPLPEPDAEPRRRGRVEVSPEDDERGPRDRLHDRATKTCAKVCKKRSV